MMEVIFNSLPDVWSETNGGEFLFTRSSHSPTLPVCYLIWFIRSISFPFIPPSLHPVLRPHEDGRPLSDANLQTTAPLFTATN